MKNTNLVEDKPIEDFDDGYSVENTLLTFAVAPSTMKSLKKVCAKLEVRIWDSDCLTDLIAVPNFLTICDFSAVDQAPLRLIYGFLIEVADSSLLFTTQPAVLPPAELKKHILKPVELDDESLRFLIMHRRSTVLRHVKTARSYDKKLARLFGILRAIREQGFVHSRDFCIEFNVSQRTIARDIELLITMGEPLEYDVRRKGYCLLQGVSDGGASPRE